MNSIHCRYQGTLSTLRIKLNNTGVKTKKKDKEGKDICRFSCAGRIHRM